MSSISFLNIKCKNPRNSREYNFIEKYRTIEKYIFNCNILRHKVYTLKIVKSSYNAVMYLASKQHYKGMPALTSSICVESFAIK